MGTIPVVQKGVENGQNSKEAGQATRCLPSQVQVPWLLGGQRQDRRQAAGMTVDIEALKSLHHAVDGYRYCPHDSQKECEEADTCFDHEPEAYPGQFFGIKLRVCAHCLVGSSGSDLPHWISESEVGIRWNHSPDIDYSKGMNFYIWPCPTAVAVGFD